MEKVIGYVVMMCEATEVGDAGKGGHSGQEVSPLSGKGAAITPSLLTLPPLPNSCLSLLGLALQPWEALQSLQAQTSIFVVLLSPDYPHLSTRPYAVILGFPRRAGQQCAPLGSLYLLVQSTDRY